MQNLILEAGTTSEQRIVTEHQWTMLRFICVLALFAASLGFDHPRVACTTTKGPLLIEIYRDWSPLGADRFLDLVKDNFFTDIAFFRCVKRFLTQFGISDVPSKKHWHREEIPDDPNLHLGIKKNYLSFAGGGPNTRSTQLFIAFEDLDFLGKEPWETPFGMQKRCQQHHFVSSYFTYSPHLLQCRPSDRRATHAR